MAVVILLKNFWRWPICGAGFGMKRITLSHFFFESNESRHWSNLLLENPNRYKAWRKPSKLPPSFNVRSLFGIEVLQVTTCGVKGPNRDYHLDSP